MSNIERSNTRKSKTLGVTTLKIRSVQSTVGVYKLEIVHRPVVVGPISKPILPHTISLLFHQAEYDELEAWILELFGAISLRGFAPTSPVEMFVPRNQKPGTRLYWEGASTAKAHAALKGY
jgi:hypothetical protein